MNKRKRFGRLRCAVGRHDVRQDPELRYVYWCARPLCRWIVGVDA